MSELRKEWVGVSTEPEIICIGARDLMNFAAGVQSERYAYYDDRAEGGIATFPTFSARFSWHAVQQLWKVMISRGCPIEVMQRQVHYRTELRNHRDFVAGEDIVVQTTLRDMIRHRSGTLMVIEVRMSTPQGASICVERVEGLLRGVACDLPSEPVVTCRRPGPGQDGADPWETHFEVSPLLPYHYDGCADIHFPIHSSTAYARKVGLPGVILQGSATLALCVDRICDWQVPGDTRVRVPEISATYGAFLLPGKTVRLVASARPLTETLTGVVFSLFGEDHQEIIRHGYLELSR